MKKEEIDEIKINKEFILGYMIAMLIIGLVMFGTAAIGILIIKIFNL
jgi:hypothetical protein